MNWINAFLCFRQQRVVVNGVKSDVSGVPQGTVLGPLLFSLYINDISVVNESEIRLVADDCVCYCEIKTEEDTLKLQRDIDRLVSWARKWGMRFQPVKCNMMQLTNKRSSKIQANYTLEGTVTENVKKHKILGCNYHKRFEMEYTYFQCLYKSKQNSRILDEKFVYLVHPLVNCQFGVSPVNHSDSDSDL